MIRYSFYNVILTIFPNEVAKYPGLGDNDDSELPS